MIFEGTKNQFFFGLELTRAGVSFPDITLLPKLATYFNVSIYELIGYEPQLTGEQIKELYC